MQQIAHIVGLIMIVAFLVACDAVMINRAIDKSQTTAISTFKTIFMGTCLFGIQIWAIICLLIRFV